MNPQDQQQLIARSDFTNVQPTPPTPVVPANVAPNGDGVYFVVRDGYKLQRVEGRQHHRRTHTFDDLRSLAIWLNRYAVPKERAEILVDLTAVGAALDPANPIGDVVTCELPRDPRFQRWAPYLACPFGGEEEPKALSQRQLHTVLRGAVADIEGTEVAGLLLHEVQNLSITKGFKRDLKIDERGYYRYAAEVKDRVIEGRIPPSFSIRVPIFEGVTVPQNAEVPSFGPWVPVLYTIEILLSMDEHPLTQELIFTLEAPALPVIARQARRDVAACLQNQLEPGLLVMLGELRLDSVAAGSTVSSGSDLHVLGEMVGRLTEPVGEAEA